MKKNKIILGVNSFFWWPHHDNWAFLFYWDKYVWINSERLDRVKYSSWYKIKKSENENRFIYGFDKAKSCIDYCLNTFWLKYTDVDLVVYLEWLKEYVDSIFPKTTEKIWVYDHHFIHACSTFYSSWYKDSAILIMDGQWKRIENWLDKMVLQSIYKWNWNTIKLMKETTWNWNRKIWIGTLYEMVTRLLDLSSEWTTMWLSSYWKNNNILWKKLLKKYNWHYFLNDEFIEWIEWSRLKFLNKELFLEKLWLKSSKLELNNIISWLSADLALQLQYEVEEAIIDLANEAHNLTKSKILCIAWWVWLNSVVNSKIVEKTKFEKVFVLPSADDSWLALWCALYWRKKIYWDKDNFFLKNYYFWREYNSLYIKNIINNYKEYFSKIEICENDLEKKVANLIEQWNIIWWFQWWSETWPRALWNRSILAKPDDIKIRDKVNNIKKRELWRPLTPSVIEWFTKKYFDLSEPESEYKYMLKVVNVIPEKKELIKWVVHIDNTARIQVVFKDDNKKYFDLIDEYRNKTGISMLLNTSFNSAWEPIVETPEDAIKMFLSTELDYLVLWNYILSKNKIYEKFIFKKAIELTNILYKYWKKEIEEYTRDVLLR